MYGRAAGRWWQVVQGHIDRQGGALAPAAVDSGSVYRQGAGRGQWIWAAEVGGFGWGRQGGMMYKWGWDCAVHT